MIRRPPRSTLFPTRRSSDLRRSTHRAAAAGAGVGAGEDGDDLGVGGQQQFQRGDGDVRRPGEEEPQWGLTRSEEHTSELQSRQYLVCRLLLEKKKNTTL